jgi:hypothetical protein
VQAFKINVFTKAKNFTLPAAYPGIDYNVVTHATDAQHAIYGQTIYRSIGGRHIQQELWMIVVSIFKLNVWSAGSYGLD